MEASELSAFQDWLRDRERSENTISNYSTSVRCFFRAFDELTKKNMIEYKRRLLQQWKPTTVNVRVIGMNSYCEFIGRKECQVRGVKIHKSVSVENVISSDEYERLISGLRKDGDEKGYWVVVWLAKTGVRVSEFIRLDKSCFDRGYCEMWTKGKMRRVYVSQSLIEESRHFFETQQGNTLFLNRYGKPYTTRGIAQNLRNWAARYGIREEVMHPHSFRHFFAKQFLRRNNNISLLADIMGHSSINTTAIYLKLSQEEQMMEFNKVMNW